MRDPNPEEIKWWKRFEKCIKDMPDTMEIITNHIGIISAIERYAVEKSFEENGSGHDIPTLGLKLITSEQVKISDWGN